jgi:hypothetical protein
VVKAEGVSGVVYKVGEVKQVWVGRGGVVGGVVVKAAGVWGVVYKMGKCQAGPGFGPDPDLGLCRVVDLGLPHRLAPGEGNLDRTGPQLQAG